MCRNIYKALLLITCNLLLVTTPLLVKAEVESAENKLEQFLDGLETFTASFEQTLFNEFGQELESSSGYVSLQQPGKFYWAYQQPYPQFLVSNGESLWIYDEDLEQVTISSIGDSIEKSPASILTGDVKIDENYEIVELGNTDGTDWIELVSKDVNSQYNAVRLGFIQDKLFGMVILDNLGQSTLIVFTDPATNGELAPGLFEFEPPTGVDIIDSRE